MLVGVSISQAHNVLSLSSSTLFPNPAVQITGMNTSPCAADSKRELACRWQELDSSEVRPGGRPQESAYKPIGSDAVGGVAGQIVA